MTYFPKIKTTPADSPSVDAFGRQRVSMPVTLFDSKQITPDRQIDWSTQLNGTSPAINYLYARSSTALTASSTTNSEAIFQTKRHFNYQPGKSLLINATFNLCESVSGIVKRVGYFSSSNGVFLEQDGTTHSFVIRSSVPAGTGSAPVEERISQANWNLDAMNGTGPSSHTVNFATPQIMTIDMQWLGVGRIRCGFDISGSTYWAHQFLHSNETVGGGVFMATPNLPFRSEIKNVSAIASGVMESICCSVCSEAGYNPAGWTFSVDRGVSVLTNVTNANLFPIISMRKRAYLPYATIVPKTLNVHCTTNSATGFRWALVLNPDVASDVAASTWIPVPSSSIEYNVARTATNVVTNGIVLQSGYTNNTTDNVSVDLSSVSFALGTHLNGINDQIVLCAQVIGGTTESFLGTISWREET